MEGETNIDKQLIVEDEQEFLDTDDSQYPTEDDFNQEGGEDDYGFP